MSGFNEKCQNKVLANIEFTQVALLVLRRQWHDQVIAVVFIPLMFGQIVQGRAHTKADTRGVTGSLSLRNILDVSTTS